MAVGAPPVPIDAGVGTGTEAFSAALAASPAEDNFRAFFMVTTQGSLSEKLVEVRRTQGAWPDTHVIAESTAIQPSWSVAVNSDGTREAAWLNTENGGELPLSGDGGWSSTTLSQVAGAPELGFTRDGGRVRPRPRFGLPLGHHLVLYSQ